MELNQFTKLTSTVCIGKTDLTTQERALQRNPDIVFATPGRLVDILTNSHGIILEEVDFLIFDEADKLLEMGFKPEVEEILRLCGYSNTNRQVLLFSATLDKQIMKIGKLALNNPLFVESEVAKGIPSNLKQQIVKLKSVKNREIRKAILLYLIEKNENKKMIVFFTTKRECHEVALLLEISGHEVLELHGDLTQTQRMETLRLFSLEDSEHEIMLATDLAGRGLDFPLVDLVINFDLVTDSSKYVHRVGRTARAGNPGQCISLYDDDELLSFKKMGRKIMKGSKNKLKIEYLPIDFTEVKSKKFLISKMKNRVRRALKEEYAQRQLEKAEMEAKKAQNMIDFKDQIMSRPKREWIVSNKQKEELRQHFKKIKTK
jgi:ATP-dependent RNA helicase DDX27